MDTSGCGLAQTKKAPPIRLSSVLSKVAKRQVKPHASAAANVAGGHSLGQLTKLNTTVAQSTLASKQIVQELQRRASKVSDAQPMQEKRTILQHNGPNHLGIVF